MTSTPEPALDVTLDLGAARIRVLADPPLAAEAARTIEAMGFAHAPAGPGDPVVRLGRAVTLPDVPPGAELRIHAHPLARGYRTGDGMMLWTPAGRSVVSADRVDAVFGEAAVPSDVTWHLTTAMHLLARAAGAYALHAAALVSPSGEGVLLVGPANAGKSTLAYALVRAGWGYVSDDSVLLCETRGGEVEALPFRRRFGLDADGPFPEAAGHAVRQPAEVAKWSVDMAALHAGRARPRAVPSRLVFPEIVDTPESQLAPLLPVEAYGRLLAEVGTRRLADGHTAAHHARLGRLLAQAPSVRLLAGRDVLTDAHRVSDLIAHPRPQLP